MSDKNTGSTNTGTGTGTEKTELLYDTLTNVAKLISTQSKQMESLLHTLVNNRLLENSTGEELFNATMATYRLAVKEVRTISMDAIGAICDCPSCVAERAKIAATPASTNNSASTLNEETAADILSSITTTPTTKDDTNEH